MVTHDAQTNQGQTRTSHCVWIDCHVMQLHQRAGVSKHKQNDLQRTDMHNSGSMDHAPHLEMTLLLVSMNPTMAMALS